MTIPNRLATPIFLFFILVSVTDLVAIFLDIPVLQTISKPLIIPALLAWYLARSGSVNQWYVVALFFSFIGDVLLLNKANLFLLGIGAFLITQVLYIFIFSRRLLKSSVYTKALATLPFLFFFIVLIKYLEPGLGEFLIPVMVYGFAISVFGMVSLLNYLIKKDDLHLKLLIGATLFIISDSMIALNKFDQERVFFPVAIMLTYIVAQYLIASYMLKSEIRN